MIIALRGVALALLLVWSGIATAQLSERAAKRMDRFVDIVDGKDSVGEGATSPRGMYEVEPKGIIAGRPLNKVRGDGWIALVAGDTGQVYSFGRKHFFNDEKSEASALKKADALSREAAFKAVLPLLKDFSLSENIEDYTLNLEERVGSFSVPEEERSLHDYLWAIRRYFSYEGVPCRERRLSVLISPLSGKVVSVDYWPMVLPANEKDENKIISRQNALGVTTEWVSQEPYFLHVGRAARVADDAVDDIAMVVACPRPYPHPEGYRKETRYVGTEAYYCWEVPFEFKEAGHLFEGVAWVRVDNSAVIGWRDRTGLK